MVSLPYIDKAVKDGVDLKMGSKELIAFFL